MFAVVRTGGKQYRVEPGVLLNIEKIPGETGDIVELSDVLLLSDGAEVLVGQPKVSGAKVVIEVVRQSKGPKLTIFKKIRRKGHQLKKGHRQSLTRVRIKEIVAP